MTNIPPHYSDRFVNQRYNKALYIVQHLPISSNVQPTKEQKLELYALYKQVTQGSINIPRPGIFDVVGRAKWDAWKKLENMGQKEAKFRYVEILLKVATEAYKKPAGRVEAHQIIQSFAAMNPNDSGDSSSENEKTSDEEAEGSSVASEEAEEIAYLREVNRSAPATTSTRQPEFQPLPKSRLEYYHQQQQQKLKQMQERSSSRASFQSMKTAPTEFSRRSYSSQNSTSNRRRPLSVASTSTNPSINRLNQSRELFDDNFDESVNPWVLQPTARQYRVDEQIMQHQQDLNTYRSPLSASSSVTTTQQIINERAAYQSDLQQTVLGPATKRALEALQNEIEALNERINGLRKELVERDQKSRNGVIRKSDKPSSDEDGWKWVFKAAVKHAVVNLMTACMILYLLHKNESPVAHAMLGFLKRFWQRLKLKVLISKVVV